MLTIKKLIVIAIAILFAISSAAQNIKKAEWSKVKMDSSWESLAEQGKESKSTKIINKYKPAVDELNVVIGEAAKDLPAHSPESELSNFAVDAIREFADKWLSQQGIEAKTEMAVTNFVGIRLSNFPKGDITIAQVMACFPFDNRIVILDMPGKYIRQMLQAFARRGRVEALSGVELYIKANKVERFRIAGEPLKDDKIYKVATIDFLANGGDNVYSFKNAVGMTNTNVQIKDMIVDKIKALTAEGKKVDPKVDGRVKIEK